MVAPSLMQWLEPRPHRRLPIRLTPLIDVVFILLLFFMLTSRLSPMGLVQLDTASAESQSDEQPSPRLHLSDDGSLRWNGESLAREDLKQQLQRHEGDAVQLSTDETVPLSAFTFWLGEIRQLNMEPHWQRNRANSSETDAPETDASETESPDP